MAVSNTYTLERTYGSRIVVQGSGFPAQQRDDRFQLVPRRRRRGPAGSAPTPTPLRPASACSSSQTPTIVARDGKVVLITGSPGSRTIINTVLNIVVNVIDFDMDVRAAVDAPRLHHQWFPDELRFEGPHDYEAAVAQLRAMGHKVRWRAGRATPTPSSSTPRPGRMSERPTNASTARRRGSDRPWVRIPILALPRQDRNPDPRPAPTRL